MPRVALSVKPSSHTLAGRQRAAAADHEPPASPFSALLDPPPDAPAPARDRSQPPASSRTAARSIESRAESAPPRSRDNPDSPDRTETPDPRQAASPDAATGEQTTTTAAEAQPGEDRRRCRDREDRRGRKRPVRDRHHGCDAAAAARAAGRGRRGFAELGIGGRAARCRRRRRRSPGRRPRKNRRCRPRCADRGRRTSRRQARRQGSRRFGRRRRVTAEQGRAIRGRRDRGRRDRDRRDHVRRDRVRRDRARRGARRWCVKSIARRPGSPGEQARGQAGA